MRLPSGDQRGFANSPVRCVSSAHGAARSGGYVDLELILLGTVGKERDLLAVGRPGDALFVAERFSVAGGDVEIADADGGLAGRRRGFDIGDARAIGRDGGLLKPARGGDLGQRGLDGRDRLGLRQCGACRKCYQ